MPWFAAAVIDPGRPLEERRSIDTNFFKLLVEHLDARFGLVNTLTSNRDHEEALDLLLSSLYPRFFWLWVWECLCAVASIEFQHGRNRRTADRSINWQHLPSCVCARRQSAAWSVTAQGNESDVCTGPWRHGCREQGTQKHRASTGKVQCEIPQTIHDLLSESTGRACEHHKLRVHVCSRSAALLRPSPIECDSTRRELRRRTSNLVELQWR